MSNLKQQKIFHHISYARTLNIQNNYVILQISKMFTVNIKYFNTYQCNTVTILYCCIEDLQMKKLIIDRMHYLLEVYYTNEEMML